MAKGFKIDGYFIPLSYDTNKDSKLQLKELNIWCKANKLKYEDGQIKTCVPFDAKHSPKKINIDEFSIENIRKRYPNSRYILNELSNGGFEVRDKNTNNFVFFKYIDSKSQEINLTWFDDSGASVYCHYNKTGDLKLAQSYIDGCLLNFTPLTTKLRKDICKKNSFGLPTTGNNFSNHINNIDQYNVSLILSEYQEKYNTSLISDIFQEYNLSPSARANYAKYIVNALCLQIESPKSEKFKSELFKEIDIQEKKIGSMDSTEIDKIINILMQNDNLDKKLLAYQLDRSINDTNIIGLSTTGKDLAENVKSINSENVLSVMNIYKDTHNGKTLLSDIIENISLNKNTRKAYLVHIINAYLAYAKAQGVSVGDLVSKFNKEITYQMDKFGFANADYLNVFIVQMEKRVKIKELNDSKKRDVKITPPNGKIDENFSQGATGDCWLLAAIKGIVNTPKGAKILKDSIKINNDGSVKVTFKGVNKSYTISKLELYNSIQLATGDGDIRALELAVNKYFEEERGSSNAGNKLDINGNQMYVAYKILIDDKNIDTNKNNIIEFYFNGMESYAEITDKIIDSWNLTNRVVTVSAFGKKNIQVKSDQKSQKLVTDHAYTVLRVDKEYVYLSNPWNANEEIKVSREIFKNFFNQYQQIDL